MVTVTCERPVQLGVFTVGEKPAPLTYIFTDFDGAVINLTGYTVKFNWGPAGMVAGTTANGSLTGTPTDGKAVYTWTGTEFQTSGPYEGQFWVGNGTNRWASVPIRWTVRDGIGVPPNI